MLKVSVCLGSACHVKGSRPVIEELQYLVSEKQLKDKVELAGIFCAGNCAHEGVCVKIEDQTFGVLPTEVKSFFEKEVLPRV